MKIIVSLLSHPLLGKTIVKNENRKPDQHKILPKIVSEKIL